MTANETAWLIEIPGPSIPSYWDGRQANTFTSDPNDVFRMARRADAERALAWKLCVPPPGEVRITEHAWMSRGSGFSPAWLERQLRVADDGECAAGNDLGFDAAIAKAEGKS